MVGPFEVAALLVVGLAVAGVVFTTVVTTRALSDILKPLALVGLFVGCSLLIQSSRRYLLGLGGALTCGFVALLLATYAGLVINASSSVVSVRLLTLHADRPAVYLSMLGLLSALLLLPSPWSRQRVWIQPVLVGISIALPTVALLILPHDAPLAAANVAGRFVARNDPLLVLGVVGLALIAPVQVIGCVAWVYFSTRGASGLLTTSPTAPRRLFAALAAWTIWLLFGIAGILPRALGGDFAMWARLRHAGAREWIVAGLVTVAAGLFISRVKGILERDEGTAAASVSLAYLIGQVGFVLAVALLLLCALFTFQAEPIAATSAVALLTAALAVGSTVVWFAGAVPRRRLLLVAMGCLVILGAALCAALAWPAAVNTVPHVGLFGGSGIGSIAEIANSNVVNLLTLVVCPIAIVVGAAVYVLVFARWADYHGSWRGTAEMGYALILGPIGVWMIVGALLLGSATLAHPLADAFARWPLPDPSEVAVVACCIVVVVGSHRWFRRDLVVVNDRYLTAAIALSAMAFVPYLVPDSFRSGGRLALAGVAIVLMAAVVTIVLTELPQEARQRRLSWQLGITAVSLPLLAYAGVSAGYSPALVGGALADTGHNVGPSLFSQLRLVLVIPLTVALIVADRPVQRLRWKNQRQSRWRDFEADVLVMAVRDGDLPDVLPVPLTRHLTALDPRERRLVALNMARALGRRYRARRSTSTSDAALEASRSDLNAALVVAERALRTDVDGDEIAAARRTVERIAKSTQSGTATAVEVRKHLTLALKDALSDHVASVDGLVGAILAEVEAAARSYLALPQGSDEERDRHLAIYRHELGELFDSLPGRFTLFQDPSVLGLTPALVLDDPERQRWGLTQPFQHPYAYVALVIALIAVVAIFLYGLLAIDFRIVPHVFHLHQ